ncbi:MAG: DNA-3-methyladenine glycosylase [Caldicoprobacterales bacterium]|jgi:DNA-3-methyladenine glycosylase|nr:DNA-3-methyladenine glycosylase [Clostridiales bacterium]
MEKPNRSFYAVSGLQLARKILGLYLVHITDHGRLIGRIVETEAYMGAQDKAAHSFNNRRTKRTEVMFGPPGHAYIYLIYGMYHCMNIVAAETGMPHAVLIRALEPVEGITKMAELRYQKNLSDCSKREVLGLTNGPGKLCQAMNINKLNNGQDLCNSNLFLLKAETTLKDDEIVTSTRINIAYAEEAIHFPYRFYINSSPYVSVRDRKQKA